MSATLSTWTTNLCVLYLWTVNGFSRCIFSICYNKYDVWDRRSLFHFCMFNALVFCSSWRIYRYIMFCGTRATVFVKWKSTWIPFLKDEEQLLLINILLNCLILYRKEKLRAESGPSLILGTKIFSKKYIFFNIIFYFQVCCWHKPDGIAHYYFNCMLIMNSDTPDDVFVYFRVLSSTV